MEDTYGVEAILPPLDKGLYVPEVPDLWPLSGSTDDIAPPKIRMATDEDLEEAAQPPLPIPDIQIDDMPVSDPMTENQPPMGIPPPPNQEMV
jgi:hypothetical protein